MKPLLMFLTLSLSSPSLVVAEQVKVQTLRQAVITALREDRLSLIILIEKPGSTNSAYESWKLRVRADETRIKELGGTFELWTYAQEKPSANPAR